ncbi:Abi family protein [Corynebacterium pseudodiphtheriticum]|uniref:Abi family protein n=1 Tax=Corynebacterium pseudodiphtheriticum TaxID=37637 RepID=UPI00234C557C|nr:Abi family protein [Corynebacterium pseudodiphtheriticum]MDC7111544.1 Abi family protein [Corynebacterium pseudodiphtheriticum]MDC7115498.1 Abi family protein [Corynebacterium pseudodiphtheriticum]
MRYQKPSLPMNEQVGRLVQRGLQADSEELTKTLRRMSYYRFSGYLWWFYTDEWEEIRPGTRLDDVLELYAFDAMLRIHVMRFAHSIEVWLRASLSNHIASKHGPMGYLDKSIYHSSSAFERDLKKLDEVLGSDSPERFIVAFQEKYEDKRPPIWMATELMSIGLLSKWYSNLKEDSLQKAISREVGLQPGVLSSFLRLFTILRNGAAHHSRIWNRHTPLKGVQVRTPPKLLKEALHEADPAQIHYILAIAAYIVQNIDPTSNSVSSLRMHLLTAHEDWLAEMDFPEGFEDDPLWNPNKK